MEAIALLKNLLHSLPKTVVVGSRAEASFPLDVREKASVAWKSAFHSADYDALNEVSLGEEEHQYWRQGYHGAHGHDVIPTLLGRGEPGRSFPLLEGKGDGMLLGRIHVDQGTKEVFPRPHEGEDRYRS